MMTTEHRKYYRKYYLVTKKKYFIFVHHGIVVKYRLAHQLFSYLTSVIGSFLKVIQLKAVGFIFGGILQEIK